MSKFALQPLLGNKSAEVAPVASDPSSPSTGSPSSPQDPKKPDVIANPLWAMPSDLTVDLYISTTPMPGEVLSLNPGPDVNLQHISWKDIQYGNWEIDRSWEGEIRVPNVRFCFDFQLRSPPSCIDCEYCVREFCSPSRITRLRYGRIFSWPLTARTTCRTSLGSTGRRFIMSRNVGAISPFLSNSSRS